MRKLLYYAALNMIRKGGIMRHRYQQYLHSGMPKSKALIAIARKLLVIIFAVVRDQSVYNKDFSTASPLIRDADNYSLGM